MTTLMPWGKKYGALVGVLVPLLGIVVYDVLTGAVGSWTVYTALTYAAIGYAASWYMHGRNRWHHYALFAGVATLVYDGITGVVMSTLLWNMPLSEAFVGQIQFTMWHLLSNVALGATVSLVVYKMLTHDSAVLLYFKKKVV